MAGAQQETLGPVDPTWLAKLSAHLGINPAKTLSAFLNEVWDGNGASAVCCREVCTILMQAESGSLPLSLVEAHAQQTLRKRAMNMPSEMSVQTILETDAHFGVDTGANGDVSVCLMMESMPAPAVAKLYLSSGVSPHGMLSPEKALLHACLHLTWPRALHDDDEYLAAQIGNLLLDEAEAFPGANRGLPRYSMHLTEVGGCLRTQSNNDLRLSQIFPKGQYMKAKRPRLSEFLMKENLQPLFRVLESTLRQSEKVVTLRTEVLLRALGPLAGLMESALGRSPSGTSGMGCCAGAHSIAMAASIGSGPGSRISGCSAGNTLSSAPGSFAAAWNLPGQDPSNYTISEDQPMLRHGDSLRLSELLEQGAEEAQREPSPAPAHHSQHLNNVFAPINHHPLFLGSLDCLSSEVPPDIRTVWGDAPPLNPPHTSYLKTPTKVDPTLVSQVGAIGARHNLATSSTPTSQHSPHSTWGNTLNTTATTTTHHPPTSHSTFAPTNGAYDLSNGLNLTINGTSTDNQTHSPPTFQNTASLWGHPDLSRMSSESDISSATPLATNGTSRSNKSGRPVSCARPVASPMPRTSFTGTFTDPILSPTHGSPYFSSIGNSWGNPGTMIGIGEESEVNGDAGGTTFGVAPSSGGASWASMPWMSSSPPVRMGSDVENGGPVNGAHGGQTSLQQTRPMNYATALRAPGQNGGQTSIRTDESAIGAANSNAQSVTLDQSDVVERLDSRSSELLQLLGDTGSSHALSELMDAQRVFVRDNRILRDEVNRTFVGIAKRYLTTEPSLAGRMDKASSATVKMLLLSESQPLGHRIPSSTGTAISCLPHQLKPQVRLQIQDLINQNEHVLKVEHFDTGVIYQLKHIQSKSEHAAIAALKDITRRSDFHTANNMPAYLTHWLMKVGSDSDTPQVTPGSRIQAASSLSKASGRPDLKKLPRDTMRMVEELVMGSQWLDWRHLDAGVMKVLQQLANTNEAEALLELRQVEDSDLSSVKNMPAYLNKCFNNRLWKVRQ